MEKTTFAVYDTSLGPITVICREERLIGLRFGEQLCEGARRNTPLSDETARQLEEYFRGARKTFELPLAPEGTAFQRAVWQALQRIPCGQTCCYGELAAAVGNPKACRAVGMANNKNPIPIVIPCHRVVGKKGDLVGYAGGLEMKKRLLELERTCL